MIAGGATKGSASPYTANATEFDTLIFDAVSNVNVSLSNTVTSHPTEDKADESDHVYSNNDKYEVTGVVTNTPISTYLGNTVTYGFGTNRTQIAVDYLRRLKESKSFFTLVTEFEVLDNCIVTNLDYKINSTEADQLIFVIGVEVLRTATTQNVTLVNVANTANGSSEQSGKAKDDGTENKSDGSSQKQTHVERTRERLGQNLPGQG